MAILSVKKLTKSFGGLTAVSNVDIEIERGELVGLIGPNGAGKTTTIRMMMNIIAPDTGTILFDGRPLGEADKSRIGYLPEERGLYRKAKLGEVLEYLAAIKGARPQDFRPTIDGWLERFGLSEWKNRKDIKDRRNYALERHKQRTHDGENSRTRPGGDSTVRRVDFHGFPAQLVRRSALWPCLACGDFNAEHGVASRILPPGFFPLRFGIRRIGRSKRGRAESWTVGVATYHVPYCAARHAQYACHESGFYLGGCTFDFSAHEPDRHAGPDPCFCPTILASGALSFLTRCCGCRHDDTGRKDLQGWNPDDRQKAKTARGCSVDTRKVKYPVLAHRLDVPQGKCAIFMPRCQQKSLGI